MIAPFGGLEPGDRLAPGLGVRLVKEGEALVLELLCCELHAVRVGDFELDADLRYRSINRPFRDSETGLRSLCERPDAEASTADQVLGVQVVVRLLGEGQTQRI